MPPFRSKGTTYISLYGYSPIFSLKKSIAFATHCAPNAACALLWPNACTFTRPPRAVASAVAALGMSANANSLTLGAAM